MNLNKTVSIYLLMLFLLPNCNFLPSEKEQSTLQELANFFGGTFLMSKGFSMVNGHNEQYIELEISDSPLVQELFNSLKTTDYAASKAAFMFYDLLEKKERENIDQIKVTINISGENHSRDIYKHSFKPDTLQEVQRLMPVFKRVSEKIKKNEFNSLLEEFSDRIASDVNLKGMKNFVVSYDSTYGEIQEVQFIGFKFFENTSDEGTPIAHLIGTQIREKENTAFGLFIIRRTQKLWSIRYDYQI